MHAKREGRGSGCCGPEAMGKRRMMMGASCCKIEAVVSVDERGQLVLPKDVRERAGIGAGDKLAIIFHGGHEGPGGSCCLTLVKADSLAEGVRTMLGPMMKEMFGQEDKK